MAKEPKLLAELRANKARTEKAAKPSRGAAPTSGPQFVGSVETLATPNPPSNYLVAALADCTNAEQCQELLEHAEAHGFDRGGQTIKLIRAKMDEFKPAAKKRGAR